MKLFVWEDVLEDYTCGMAVALAENATEAKELLIKAGVIRDRWTGVKLDGVKPTVRTAKCAFFVHGGG